MRRSVASSISSSAVHVRRAEAGNCFAIESAGATDSLLASGESPALDRLLSGKTPAAVLTLVYPETGFSMIEGYSVFRVPL